MTDRGPTAEELAREIETIRHGLSEALVLADLANYQGDTPPFTSGYDDVHDAENAVWLAAKAADRLPAALKEAIAGANERAAKIVQQFPYAGIKHQFRDDVAGAIRNLPPEHQDEGK